MTPVPMTASELADLLRDLAEAVRTGDSLEGSLEYLLPDDDDANARHELMVQAALRTGNRNGQGGMITIGRYVEDPAPAPAATPHECGPDCPNGRI